MIHQFLFFQCFPEIYLLSLTHIFSLLWYPEKDTLMKNKFWVIKQRKRKKKKKVSRIVWREVGELWNNSAFAKKNNPWDLAAQVPADSQSLDDCL